MERGNLLTCSPREYFFRQLQIELVQLCYFCARTKINILLQAPRIYTLTEYENINGYWTSRKSRLKFSEKSSFEYQIPTSVLRNKQITNRMRCKHQAIRCS